MWSCRNLELPKDFCNVEMMIVGQNYRTFDGAGCQYFWTGDYILYDEVEDNSFKVFMESQCTPWLSERKEDGLLF